LTAPLAGAADKDPRGIGDGGAVVGAELYAQGALTKPSQVDEAMRRIKLEAERMSGLVDDMLRLARPALA
jgi:hypothetical protein